MAADVVFEVTGVPDLINSEFDVLKAQGRFVLLSSPRGPTLFDFHDHCNFFSHEIIGAHMCSQPSCETPYNPWTGARNRELFFRHLAAEMDLDRLVTHRTPARKAPEVFMELLRDRSRAMGVVLEWSDEGVAEGERLSA